MQRNFIEELENRGKENIESNSQKINSLDEEVEKYLNENDKLEIEKSEIDIKLEEYSGARQNCQNLIILRERSLKR